MSDRRPTHLLAVHVDEHGDVHYRRWDQEATELSELLWSWAVSAHPDDLTPLPDEMVDAACTTQPTPGTALDSTCRDCGHPVLLHPHGGNSIGSCVVCRLEAAIERLGANR